MKKPFALASVIGLSALVVTAVACSSAEDGLVAYDPIAADAAPYDVRPPIYDHPPDGATTCPSNAPIHSNGEPFKTPQAPVVGACTDADFQAMEATVNAGNVSALGDLAMNVSASCVACAFTQGSATVWGPIVLNLPGGEELFNVGACLALVSGDDFCGKAYAALDDCLDIACTDCSTDSLHEACVPNASEGICRTQRQGFLDACGPNAQTYVQQCESAGKGGCTTCAGMGGDVAFAFESYVVAQCVRDPRDLDASALDAGGE